MLAGVHKLAAGWRATMPYSFTFPMELFAIRTFLMLALKGGCQCEEVCVSVKRKPPPTAKLFVVFCFRRFSDSRLIVAS